LHGHKCMFAVISYCGDKLCLFFNELRNMIEIDFELKMSFARPRIIAGNEEDN